MSAASVALAMMLGAMVGTAVGSRWLTSVSDARLHAAVRVLLLGIGVLLIAESMASWDAALPPASGLGPAAVAAVAGVGIGAVSTLLGVAGGELIIPTLTLGFGIPIKAAGTTSLLISVPTMLVGIAHHRARGRVRGGTSG